MEYLRHRYSILFPTSDGANEFHTYEEKIKLFRQNQENFQDLILQCSNNDYIIRDRLEQYSVSKLYNDLQKYVIDIQKKNNNNQS